MICWHRQNVSCVQIVSVHHPGDVTAMFAPDLQFFDPYPLFGGGKNAEALQKILHLEIFWGFRTRTAPAGGGQYLSGGGAGRGDGRPGRCRAAGWRCPGQRQAVEAEKEGGRGLDKAAIA